MARQGDPALHPSFQATLQRSRADFLIARRDDLQYLSSRAMETLLAILDNAHASPSTQARVAMFILSRGLAPKRGWSLWVTLPDPNNYALNDSAQIENELDRLVAVEDLPDEDEAESEPAPVTLCDGLQPNSEIFDPNLLRDVTTGNRNPIFHRLCSLWGRLPKPAGRMPFGPGELSSHKLIKVIRA